MVDEVAPPSPTKRQRRLVDDKENKELVDDSGDRDLLAALMAMMSRMVWGSSSE
jgi:hypothetical protein